MEISIFFARLLGVYLLVNSILYMLRINQMQSMTKEFLASKSLLALSGEISLLFGLSIVVYHTVWEFNWRGLITFLGYLLILRGIMRLAFPNQVKSFVSNMKERTVWASFIVMLIIGIYLAYCGFGYEVTLE